jgi:hypothetical protein
MRRNSTQLNATQVYTAVVISKGGIGVGVGVGIGVGISLGGLR